MGIIIESGGLFNPGGFGIDPFGWGNTYGEIEWETEGSFSEEQYDDFIIFYEGEYFSGPASISVAFHTHTFGWMKSSRVLT